MGEIVDVSLMVNFIVSWFRIRMCIVGVYSMIIVVIEYNIFDIYSMDLWFSQFVVGFVIVIFVIVLNNVEVIIKFFNVGVVFK